MKALKYKSPWNIALEEVEDLHVIQPNDVVVDVKYTGICGTDIGIISGAYPAAVEGVTIGHESTGIIAEVGEDVTNVQVGDRVVINPTSFCGECRMCRTQRINHCENKAGTESGVSYDGTFAQKYRTTSGYVHKIPDHISMEAAALTEPLSCVLSGVRKINAPMNVNAYVFGAGPMGLLYTWALTLKGMVPVVVETSKERLEFAKGCLPKNVQIFDSLEKARTEFFGDPDAALDVVVDTTPGLLEQLYPIMACGSIYMSIGLKSKQASINIMQLADKSLTVMGSIDSLHGSFMESFHLITSNVIPTDKLVSHVIPLSEYKGALATLGCDLDAKEIKPPVVECAKVLLEIDK